ncbi:hypothetical protein E4U91_11030 [Streptomyces lasalocidi]|uniref:Uncharacterized protein n=1 Tax=Streptomyces lasalocidi TaxID=324833 RepID=A0A4U5WJE4_STRLS|nr:hypothetical protein E4U91_11030 [Streptomyces lasalocidi]
MGPVGGGAAARAGEGAVQVPSARGAVVHDAGRLSSRRVTFLGSPVKVVWETGRSGAGTCASHPPSRRKPPTGPKAAVETVETVVCSTH